MSYSHDLLFGNAPFRRYIETIVSSSLTAIIETDAGRAYLKAINNPQGLHVLACDWIGTKLARRFGLKTFDIAILELAEDDEILLDDQTNADPVPAFVTRAEDGHPMTLRRPMRENCTSGSEGGEPTHGSPHPYHELALSHVR